MDFELTDVQRAWRDRARALGQGLADDAAAADVILGAGQGGLLEGRPDLLGLTIAVEALACESPSAGMALALHTAVMLALVQPQQADGQAGADERIDSLGRGELVGALSLSSEDVPALDDTALTGRASWVGPLTDRGLALVGARRGGDVVACAVPLDAPHVHAEIVQTSALRGFTWGYVTFTATPCVPAGPPASVMARARVLIAAVALGIGSRALRESLAVVHRERGAGGEQTVQGLLADTATELDAARLLTWQAAAAPGTPSLASASMAKLSASSAAQAAVVRATQVVGVDSFRRGHVIERLTQDVRAIELFAGRTEALREAVADDALPRR